MRRDAGMQRELVALRFDPVDIQLAMLGSSLRGTTTMESMNHSLEP